MSLIIYNGTTGLVDKLGYWFGIARKLVDNRTDIQSRIDAAYASYAASEQFMTSQIDTVYQELASAGTDPAVLASVATAAKTLVNFVDAAIPLPTRSVSAALDVLVQQMVLQSKTVQTSSVSGSSAYQGTPVGDGSLLFPTLGQNVYSQIITATCVQDAYTGTQTGREVFNISTPQAVRQPFSTQWARGTGVTIRASPLYYLGGPANGPLQQMLANGAFGSFTGSAPDSWTINSGSSTISSVSGAVQGTLAMLWTGDGSTLQNLSQNLNGSAGARLLPNTTMEVGFWVKRGAVAPTGGTTKLEIIGDSGAVLASASIADASLTTSYQLVTATFTTTDVVPVAPYAVISHITTAIQSTRTITVSCAFVCEPVSFGTGRAKATTAQFVLYSGSTPFRNGDTILGTVTNNRGGDVQTWFDRFFGTASLGIVLPSSGSPTIPDSVIPT